jgi:RNA 2',3'-cyclic 3'-phosphodiesterase
MAQKGPVEGNGTQQKDGDTEKRARLFVAIELPESVKKSLTDLRTEIKRCGFDAKWTTIKNIHLTLKFLGNTSVSTMGPLNASLAAAVAGLSPITLRAQGLSVFPGPKRPRVLWAGAGGETDKLAVLQQRVEENLSALGFEGEDRKFTPHLTLARFKGKVDPEPVISAMTRYGNFASDYFTVDAIHLIESRLTPQGPVYVTLQSYCLTCQSQQ